MLTVLPNPDLLGRTDAERWWADLPARNAERLHGRKLPVRHCKNAFAQYRARRRAVGKDDPAPATTRDTDGHIPRDWFRNQIWRPALAEAG